MCGVVEFLVFVFIFNLFNDVCGERFCAERFLYCSFGVAFKGVVNKIGDVGGMEVYVIAKEECV